MIIEFFGPPGAGKTTIAKTFCRENKATLIIIANRWERYWYDLVYLIFNPIRFCRLFLIIVCQSFPSLRLFGHKLHRFSGYAAVAVKAARSSVKGDIVIDEGLAQHFFSLYERPASLAAIKDYFFRYLAADWLVLVVAEETLCLERMRDRGRIPRSHTGFDWRRWFKTIASHTNLIKKDLIKSPTKLLILDTSAKPLQLTIKELCDRVSQRR
jgi:hypothetical protein